MMRHEHLLVTPWHWREMSLLLLRMCDFSNGFHAFVCFCRIFCSSWCWNSSFKYCFESLEGLWTAFVCVVGLWFPWHWRERSLLSWRCQLCFTVYKVYIISNLMKMPFYVSNSTPFTLFLGLLFSTILFTAFSTTKNYQSPPLIQDVPSISTYS